jgi:hypothetical protein
MSSHLNLQVQLDSDLQKKQMIMPVFNDVRIRANSVQ